MDILNLELTGLSPLMMHSEKGCNPLDPEVKEMKTITGKRKKTDEDHETIAFMDWKMGMYFDEKIGPYIPGINIRSSFVDGGKLNKLGTALQKGTMILAEKVKLEFEGPRTIEKLWADPQYRDIRSVVVNKARTMRCRPMFHNWRCVVEINYDTRIIDKDNLLLSANNAGMFIGIGDFRPGKGNGSYGRYSVAVV